MLRPAAGDNPAGTLRIRATVPALACFLIGATYSIKINVIGEATLAELLLPLMGLYALLRPQGRRIFGSNVFWLLLLSMLVTLCGYMLTDYIRETPSAQYLRGWGRMALVITGFVCLSLLVAAHKQNLWWFVAGMGIGRVLYLRFVLDTPISMWKFSHNGFGYGEPVTLVAAVLAYFLPPRWAAGVLAAVGVISVHYDYRIQSLVCLFVAGLVWMRARRPNQPIRGGPLKLALILLASVVVIYAGLKISETRYSADRRDVSDIGRSVGKVFALKAIANSPIIGYGSWSRSRDFERMHEQAMKEVAGKQARRFTAGDSSSATHAMLLQAWVEGGILAIAFFVALGFCLLRELPRLALRRPLDGLSPLLAYFMIYGLWHIAMSAFAAPLRLHLALAAASVVCLALERVPARRPVTESPVAGPTRATGVRTIRPGYIARR
ncbi:MAG: O-antigen ligase family protein [Burkholderiales bacterium]